MAGTRFSTKKLQLDKANLYIVVTTSIATFVTIFCLVGIYSLLGQHAYHQKVIGKKTDAKKQLEVNLDSVNSLKNSYQQFVDQQPNIIGGSNTGQADRDGDNAKIVLDALPSAYDFPALATSLEKLVTSNNAKIASISGVDDELNQAEGEAAASGSEVVPMPFSLSVAAGYQPTKDLFSLFQRSVRPFKINTVNITNDANGTLTTTIEAETYYQPATKLKVKTEVVK